MQSPSRRAFLSGRRVSQSPWEAFLSQLRRQTMGRVTDFSIPSGSARLVVEEMQDVYRARKLCVEFGITMALDGIQHSARLNDRPVLWVDPGLSMSRHERLSEGDSRWFVQPGCLIGDLEQEGLPQFADQPPHLTVAAWLADRRICDWPAGQTMDSGLQHAMVLLADGTRANLGEFGPDNRKPLDNARVQAMVPRLFELAGQEAAAQLRHGDLWQGRYRLDALTPQEGHTINLSHLLLGHGGELGWVEWLVLDERHGRVVERPYGERYGQRDGTTEWHTDVDLVVRQQFDPDGVLPDRGQSFA